MKKVLLVDDEQLITLSVAKMIERSQEPYELVGSASNGLDALEFLKLNPVDIAIVDIRMPQLDGIGLLEEISRLQLPVRVIILSAYRDFEYAQQAIQFGAGAYLLKPLSQKSLMNALKDVSILVEQDSEWKNAASLLTQKTIQQAVYDLLEKGVVSPNLPPSLASGQKGCLLMLSCSAEYAQPFVEDCQELGWEPYRDSRLVRFIPEEPAAEAAIEKIASQTRALIKDYLLPGLTIACSDSGFSCRELHLACVQCKVAAMYSFYLPQESVIFYSDVHLFGSTLIKTVVAEFDRLHQYIRLSSKALILSQLDKIYQDLKVSMSANPQTIYQLFYEIFMELRALARKGAAAPDFQEISLHRLQGFASLDALYQFTNAQIRHYFDDGNALLVEKDDRMIEKIREYCDKNYANDCTLDDIADSVYISKSYLSQIFKEKCGVSIWNYFTDIRIAKAKELLSTGEIKANKVGEMVGFKNPSHFGHIFKSRVGVSPGDFQQRIHSSKPL